MSLIKTSDKHPKVNCPLCLRFISKKNISRHMRTHKGHEQANVVCVDKSRGIYLVKTLNSGTGIPVHVQITLQNENIKFECSRHNCRSMTGPAARGQQNFVCEHIRAALNSSNTVPSSNLPNLDSLRMSA